MGNANRYSPVLEIEKPAFDIITKKAKVADEVEIAQNPRSRSAKLRVARRTDVPSGSVDHSKIGMPYLQGTR